LLHHETEISRAERMQIYAINIPSDPPPPRLPDNWPAPPPLPSVPPYEPPLPEPPAPEPPPIEPSEPPFEPEDG